MNRKQTSLCIISLTILVTACGDTTREAERNLDLLSSKALSLDSIINVESQRLKILDSTIADELMKAGKLDSMITRESMRIDSIVRKVYRNVEQKTRQ